MGKSLGARFFYGPLCIYLLKSCLFC